jgi:oligosaccharyltransferase complex subunit beta
VYLMLRQDPFIDLIDHRGVKSGTAQFARDVAAWTFQESLVLRIDNTTHHLVGASAPSQQYTVNDKIVRFDMGIPA